MNLHGLSFYPYQITLVTLFYRYQKETREKRVNIWAKSLKSLSPINAWPNYIPLVEFDQHNLLNVTTNYIIRLSS